jgi:hypothetical protein
VEETAKHPRLGLEGAAGETGEASFALHASVALAVAQHAIPFRQQTIIGIFRILD